MPLTVKPLISKRMNSVFDVFESLVETLERNSEKLESGDIIVISTKFVSNAQGRLVDVKKIKTSRQGNHIAEKFQIRSDIAEIILRESDEIFGGVTGFVMTTTDNIMAPNAGIDKSNAGKNKIILYPKDPYVTAEQIRRKIFLKYKMHTGIILTDSRLMPLRIGTSAVAIACAGIEPVLDMRGEKDLDGNPLKVTFQAVVDNIATIANHKMGEGSESKPFAIVRDSGAKITNRKISPDETAVPPEQCVYVRGLSNTNHTSAVP